MAFSVITYTGDGATTQYALNFELGILSRDHVQCRVGDEVDGLGDPLYRTLTWITDGLVEIQGDVPALDEPIRFTRTVPKDALIHDYSDGAAIQEENLDESNLQSLMAIHEFLDGRITSFSDNLDLGGFKIVNVGAGSADTDVATMQQLNATIATVSASVTLAQNWANKTDGVVASGEQSAKAYAIGGTGVTDTAGKGAAKEWATKAEDSTVDGTEYSAKHYAAKTAADRVQTGLDRVATGNDVVTTGNDVTTTGNAVTAAEAARDKAQLWADEDEDQEVEAGLYSAKHWAAKAAESAAVSADNISFDNAASGLTATKVQDAIDELDTTLDNLGDLAELDTVDTAQIEDDAVTSDKVDSSVAVIALTQTFSGAQRASQTALTSTSNSIAVNFSLNNDFTLTMTENSTLANPTNIAVGQSGSIFGTQGASSYTLAYGAYWTPIGGTDFDVPAGNGDEFTIHYTVRSTTSIEYTMTVNQ